MLLEKNMVVADMLSRSPLDIKDSEIKLLESQVQEVEDFVDSALESKANIRPEAH